MCIRDRSIYTTVQENLDLTEQKQLTGIAEERRRQEFAINRRMEEIREQIRASKKRRKLGRITSVIGIGLSFYTAGLGGAVAGGLASKVLTNAVTKAFDSSGDLFAGSPDGVPGESGIKDTIGVNSISRGEIGDSTSESISSGLNTSINDLGSI